MPDDRSTWRTYACSNCGAHFHCEPTPTHCPYCQSPSLMEPAPEFETCEACDTPGLCNTRRECIE